jgi:hypothetical protein
LGDKTTSDLFNQLVEHITNPTVAAVVIVLCFAIYRGPAYIKALGELVRANRINRLEVARKQVALDQQLEKAKAKIVKKQSGDGT